MTGKRGNLTLSFMVRKNVPSDLGRLLDLKKMEVLSSHYSLLLTQEVDDFH